MNLYIPEKFKNNEVRDVTLTKEDLINSNLQVCPPRRLGVQFMEKSLPFTITRSISRPFIRTSHCW